MRLRQLIILALLVLTMPSCALQRYSVELESASSPWVVSARLEWDRESIYDTIIVKYTGEEKIQQLKVMPRYGRVNMPEGYTPPGRWTTVFTAEPPDHVDIPPQGLVVGYHDNKSWKKVKKMLGKDAAIDLLKNSSIEITWVTASGEQDSSNISFGK
ncbi:hypothetical protein SY88_17860 [Clostridiales bacterium PH28_bin88]|nr:hypothetical protein SY88_17860 [Clostridiales bacterium PH28_bin88]